MSSGTISWIITSIAQITMFFLLVWWVALIKLTTSILTLILGPEYKQSLFGKHLRNTEFTLDAYATFVNHGSFGTVPRVVQEAQQRLKDEMEQCPGSWFFYKARPMWNKSITAIAKFVNADPKNLVFVLNATTGVNTVLKSLDLPEGQGIVVTNQTYGAIYKTAQDVCLSKKCNLVVLNITFQTSDLDGSVEFYAADIVEQYRKVLKENPNIKLAIVDYITSASAMKMPVSKIIQVCHEFGVMVLVDGAHAPGQVPLELESLNADFFVGNLHKWMFTPRGSAILWVHPKYQDTINPLVVSWNQDLGFQDKFFMQGTQDQTSYLVIDSASKFYYELGGMNAITGYNKCLASWASLMLATEWKTEVLPIPESMRAPFMASIRLPLEFTAAYGTSCQSEFMIRRDLFQRYRVLTAVCCIQSSLWCRISANVYNTKEDYMKLADAFNRLKHALNTGYKPDVKIIGNSLGPSPAESLTCINQG
ncbi:putative L-cysteine desulfhydrase 1 [Actinia tenebrosa]|uniref:L-cysteine desulfhydrase 1 n=1 Tax=Actinia tenebrosa TaxID=6105 RepID=A0A6P8IQ73_ACTTE|nr:putative L-cysteine desulfhydrase 1 [Actinia tenebrosa]